MRVTLTVVAGTGTGRVFTFEGHDTFIVGRSKHAHFQLFPRDLYCSRMHFMVEVNPPHCRLVDFGSNNGTHVNGQKVQTADLKDGDEIRAGRTVLRLSVQEAEPQTISLAHADRPARGTNTVSLARAPAQEEETGLCPACAAAVGIIDPTLPLGLVLCPACQAWVEGQPQPIAGYQILCELGRGGMGVVYLAIRKKDGALLALKTITPAVVATQAQVARFLREASILCQLEHPNIVSFLEIGASSGRLFFAMDYVPGIDGERLVKNHGCLAVGRAAELVCQLLEALEYAHARGFVHRDVKPRNLMVMKRDGVETLKLVDFGLARVYQESQLSGLTLTGDIGGTPAFTAPEQITDFRRAQPLADQYSAGATLYRLLTGQHVHDLPRESHKQFLMILNKSPVSILDRRPDIPLPLADIIHRCLERDPNKRFADVRAARKALLPFCAAAADPGEVLRF